MFIIALCLFTYFIICLSWDEQTCTMHKKKYVLINYTIKTLIEIKKIK